MILEMFIGDTCFALVQLCSMLRLCDNQASFAYVHEAGYVPLHNCLSRPFAWADQRWYVRLHVQEMQYKQPG